MKKVSLVKKIYLLLTPIITLMSLILFGASSFLLSFNLNSNHGNVACEPVCYNADSGVYYTSIEKAIEDANSSNYKTINVIPGTNPIIKRNCTINDGTILNIPPIISTYYKASLNFSNDNIVSFEIKKSTDGSNYRDFVKWTGKYLFFETTSSFTSEIVGSNISKKHQSIKVVFDSQVLNGAQTNISISMNASFTGTYLNYIFGKTYHYNYSFLFNNMSFYDDEIGVTVLVGSFTFNRSKNGGNSEISSSNIGNFTSDNSVINYSFENVSNYSMEAKYNTLSLSPQTFTNIVSIDDDVVVNNYGSIYVGGTLSGGGGSTNYVYCGQSLGNLSKLVMKSDSVLNNYGNIYTYGYIEEEKSNNGSKINFYSGQCFIPFVVRDFKGGSYTYGIYNDRSSKRCFPFNHYEVKNITAECQFFYNSTLTGMANLYAGSQQNSTQMNIFGNNSSSFVQMTDSTYSSIITKFNETSDKSNGVCDITIIGGAILNTMSLSLKLPVISAEANSIDYDFPISFRHRIFLRKNENQVIANFDLGSSNKQRLKLLPGTFIDIGEDCNVNFFELNMYSSRPLSTTSIAKYPTTYSAAYIINDGKVTSDKLVGLVKSNVTGAELQIKNSDGNIYTSYEVTSCSGSNILTKASFQEITNYLTFYRYDSANNTFDLSEYNTSVPVGTYYSIIDSNGITGFVV